MIVCLLLLNTAQAAYFAVFFTHGRYNFPAHLHYHKAVMKLLSMLASSAVLLLALGSARAEDVPVTFSGGHDIGKDDHGRPCVLIAAALGVETKVFREAFSGVTPAKDGKPSDDEARKNKAALLKVLGPHGVTNDRLDEVSNYYRFQPQKGDLWKHMDAKAHAVVEGGKVVKIVVDEAGSGYTTPPNVTVKGMEKLEFEVMLSFDKDVKKNGAIKSIEVKSEVKN